jgi:hypothetical protein
MLPQRFAVLAFPPTPPLAGFPHTTQLPTSEGSNSSSGSGTWSLRFCLLAAPAQQPERGQTSSAAAGGEAAGTAAAAAGGWRFWLAAVRSSLHGVPQVVLQLQDVPLQLSTVAAPPTPPGTTAAPAPSAVQPAADVVAAAAAAAAALQPEWPASVSPSKRKRQREAAVDEDAEVDVRPHKQLREAGANGLLSGGVIANGLSVGPETTSSSVHASNGTAAAPALLGNGHVLDSAPAAAPGVEPIAANGAASEPAAAAPAAPLAVAAASAAAAAAAAAPAPAAPAAGLEHAMAWCRGRLTWTSLVLQLQVRALLAAPGNTLAACSKHFSRQSCMQCSCALQCT